MTQLDDNKMTVSLSVKTKVIDKALAKKYFKKIPISDEDYLYSVFAYGLAQAELNNSELFAFVQMMIDFKKVELIEV